MKQKEDSIDEWQFLIGKTINTTYLGTIGSKWKVVYNTKGKVSITTYKEKILRSVVGSVFLLVFITIRVFIEGIQSNALWLLGIPVIWLLIGLRLGYRKELLWESNADEFYFVSGFCMLTKKIAIDRKKISAKLKYSDKLHSKGRKAVISLYNKEYPSTRLKLISSTREVWLVPVVNALKDILADNFSEEQ